MTPPVHSLDARYYTDPQVFIAEQTGLFARSWQFACHLSELPSAGCYTSFEIGGEALFAVRAVILGFGSFIMSASIVRISWSLVRDGLRQLPVLIMPGAMILTAL